jgi:hypothetical protein
LRPAGTTILVGALQATSLLPYRSGIDGDDLPLEMSKDQMHHETVTLSAEALGWGMGRSSSRRP